MQPPLVTYSIFTFRYPTPLFTKECLGSKFLINGLSEIIPYFFAFKLFENSMILQFVQSDDYCNLRKSTREMGAINQVHRSVQSAADTLMNFYFLFSTPQESLYGQFHFRA